MQPAKNNEVERAGTMASKGLPRMVIRQTLVGHISKGDFLISTPYCLRADNLTVRS